MNLIRCMVQPETVHENKKELFFQFYIKMSTVHAFRSFWLCADNIWTEVIETLKLKKKLRKEFFLLELSEDALKEK